MLIEHEFGIFGGDCVEVVLTLADELTVPMVVTLHRVGEESVTRPGRHLRALCRRAALVMVFTETARRMVVEQGLAEFDRVRVVPHGAPDILTAAAWSDGSEDTSCSETRSAEPSPVVPVLSTFESQTQRASNWSSVPCQQSPAAHPEVIYLIAGQTHPEVIHKESESYRLGLQRLVHDLDVSVIAVWFVDAVPDDR